MLNGSPTARIGVGVQVRDITRLKIRHYGEDDSIPNPGDLLIASHLGMSGSTVEFAMIIPGRDMTMLAREVNLAASVYEVNRVWLSAPVTSQRPA